MFGVITIWRKVYLKSFGLGNTFGSQAQFLSEHPFYCQVSVRLYIDYLLFG